VDSRLPEREDMKRVYLGKDSRGFRKVERRVPPPLFVFDGRAGELMGDSGYQSPRRFMYHAVASVVASMRNSASPRPSGSSLPGK